MAIRYVPRSYTRRQREEYERIIRDWPDSGSWAEPFWAQALPDSEARKEAKLRVLREMRNQFETRVYDYEEWARDEVYLYEYFPFSYVFIPGMAAIGVGAILLIVGLTTKAGNP